MEKIPTFFRKGEEARKGKNRNIVLEHNKKIVAKNIWVNTFIKAEDIIEILTIVGGG